VRLFPRLAALDGLLLDSTLKGYPGTAAPVALGAIAERRYNVLAEDLPFPVAVLKASSLAHNRATMQRFLAATGVKLSPHGKTTMSPQLFALQLADGAFAITCATSSQLQVYRRFGIRRVLMANQVVGRQAIDYILGEIAADPDFELYLLVDSVEGVARLAHAAARAAVQRPLRVLIEVGAAGARTGARTLAVVDALIEAVLAAGPWLALHGVEAFEDVIAAPPEERERAIRELLALELEAGVRARRAAPRATPFILSAGGSAYFDLAAALLGGGAAALEATVVLRSGCYLTHDHGTYATAETLRRARAAQPAAAATRFEPALEVWSQVQSRPEPARAYLTAGKRDVSFDLDLPLPVAWLRPGVHAGPQPLDGTHRIVRLNDQHAHLELPASSPLAVGDLVALGISHPCTTFDRWQLIYVVDEHYTVIDALRTFF